jgi:hypothetical protein
LATLYPSSLAVSQTARGWNSVSDRVIFSLAISTRFGCVVAGERGSIPLLTMKIRALRRPSASPGGVCRICVEWFIPGEKS